MNHSAKNSTTSSSHTMGCTDFMMSIVPMIMRQPLGGVIIHIV